MDAIDRANLDSVKGFHVIPATCRKEGMVVRALFSAFFFCSLSARAADSDEVRPVFGKHPGYLFNVGEEKTKRDVEMVMLEKPKPPPAKKKVVLVDEKLTKEFQAQYQYRFGTSTAEQVINTPQRDGGYAYQSNFNNVTGDQYRSYQRSFGNYMIRRLFEYHLDNYFKSEPSLKTVYEAKDKLNNMNVQMKNGFKLKFKYNLSDPSLDVNLENPYDVETRVQVLMSGLLTPKEEIVSLGYMMTKDTKLALYYRNLQKLSQVVISRTIKKHFYVSLTGSSGFIPDTQIHQDLTLVGFGWRE